MSEYYIKQRGHLEVLLESLISDDVDAYLYDSRDSAWGLIYHKPSNVIMTIGYDGVNGISLSSCLKPNTWHGTGYQCLESGFRWITKEDLDAAFHKAKVLLAKDIMAHRETKVPGICLPDDLQKHLYRDLDEYFETRWPGQRAREKFIQVMVGEFD